MEGSNIPGQVMQAASDLIARAEHDASLVAELLTELKDIRDRFHSAILCGGSDAWAADAACAKADAAIAKAEGRT